MKEEELKAITDSISSKLGEEASALIADDLGKLITSNSNTLTNINNLNKEISTLKDTNQKLVSANGSLLQQIPMSNTPIKKEEVIEEEEKKSFNFRDFFDSKGNFIN